MCTGTIIVVTGIQNRLGPAHRGNRIVHSKVVAEVTVAMWNTTSTITISINNIIIRSIRMLLSIKSNMLMVKRRGTIMVEVVAVVEAVVIISIISTPSMITTKNISSSSTNNIKSIISSNTSNMNSIISSNNNNLIPNKNNIRKVVVTGVALLERCRSYTSANRNPSSRKSTKSTCAANAGNPETSTTWVGTRSRTSGAASSRL